MIKKIKNYFTGPFSASWSETKKYYEKEHFDSYYMCSRRVGSLYATERLQACNFFLRFVPYIIIFKFFNWYSCSTIGRILENLFHKN